MAGFSDYLENKILEHTLKNTTYTPVATVYASLHTADPGDTGASECTGGSYARKSCSWAAAGSGSIATNAALTWTDMPACTVKYVGIWDTVSGGNNLYAGGLTANKTLNAGDTFEIASGNLTVTAS